LVGTLHAKNPPIPLDAPETATWTYSANDWHENTRSYLEGGSSLANSNRSPIAAEMEGPFQLRIHYCVVRKDLDQSVYLESGNAFEVALQDTEGSVLKQQELPYSLEWQSALITHRDTSPCTLVISPDGGFYDYALDAVSFSKGPFLEALIDDQYVGWNQDFVLENLFEPADDVHYRFYKDGALLAENATGRLTIEHFSASNEGVYYVEAENDQGLTHSNYFEIIGFDDVAAQLNSEDVTWTFENPQDWALEYQENGKRRIILRNYSSELTYRYRIATLHVTGPHSVHLKTQYDSAFEIQSLPSSDGQMKYIAPGSGVIECDVEKASDYNYVWKVDPANDHRIELSIEDIEIETETLILRPINDYEFRSGESIRLNIATRFGNESVEWYKNGVLLAGSDITLELTPTQADDNATIQAKVSRGGRVEWSNEAHLKLVSQRYSALDNHFFDFSLSETPSYSISSTRNKVGTSSLSLSTWDELRIQSPNGSVMASCWVWFDLSGRDDQATLYYRDGMFEYTLFMNDLSEGWQKLYFPVNPEDEYVTEFRLTTEEGSQFYMDGLSTESGPQILLSPNDHIRNFGSSVIFAVLPSGLDQAQIQWYKDGSPIPGATEMLLLIENLQQSDIGAYQAKVSYGSTTIYSDEAQLSLVAFDSETAWGIPREEISINGLGYITVVDPEEYPDSPSAVKVVVETEGMLEMTVKSGAKKKNYASMSRRSYQRNFIDIEYFTSEDDSLIDFFHGANTIEFATPSEDASVTWRFSNQSRSQAMMENDPVIIWAYDRFDGPVITKQIYSHYYNGDNFLYVNAEGEDLHYEWYKDGEPIGRDGTRLPVSTNDIDYPGEYWVRVSDANGFTDSRVYVATLQVSEDHPLAEASDAYLYQAGDGAPWTFSNYGSFKVTALPAGKTSTLGFTYEGPFFMSVHPGTQCEDGDLELWINDALFETMHFDGSDTQQHDYLFPTSGPFNLKWIYSHQGTSANSDLTQSISTTRLEPYEYLGYLIEKFRPEYGLSEADFDKEADPDLDGTKNIMEWYMGSDPFVNDKPYMHVQAIKRPGNTEFFVIESLKPLHHRATDNGIRTNTDLGDDWFRPQLMQQVYEPFNKTHYLERITIPWTDFVRTRLILSDPWHPPVQRIYLPPSE